MVANEDGERHGTGRMSGVKDDSDGEGTENNSCRSSVEATIESVTCQVGEE